MFYAKIIIVMLLWALCFPLIVIGMPFAPHLSFAALRALIAGATLISIAIILKRPMPRTLADWRGLFIIGAGATTLGFLGMYHAAEFVGPGIATVIASTQPLLAAILAHYILRERIRRAGIASLAIGFGGILVISVPHLANGSADTYAIGTAYLILAALGTATGNVWIKKMSGELDGMVAMGIQLLIGGALLAVLAALTEDPSEIQWTWQFLISLFGLALFGTALVYWMWYNILSEVPLTRANIFKFLVPVFGLAIGAMFYGEVLTWWTAIGTSLTILAICFFQRSSD